MRRKTFRTVLALLAAATLLAGACSSGTPAETATGDGSRLGQAKKGSKKGAKADPGGRKDGRKGNDGGGGKSSPNRGGSGGNGSGPGEVASPAPASDGAAASGGFASDGPPSPVDPSLARRSSFVDDPVDAKKEGALAPGYAEIVRCGIQGVGEQFEMHFQFNGAVPREMPDKNTIMVIGVGISAGGNDTYGFTAQGNQDGWKAYAGAKDEPRKFPGQFLIQGDTIIMRAPWRFVGGPREFRWQLNATWFRSVASTTHYSFDQCPNDSPGQFPS